MKNNQVEGLGKPLHVCLPFPTINRKPTPFSGYKSVLVKLCNKNFENHSYNSLNMDDFPVFPSRLMKSSKHEEARWVGI